MSALRLRGVLLPEEEQRDVWIADGRLTFSPVADADLVADGGWIAFCLKEDFMTDGEPSGFARLIRDLIAFGELKVLDEQRYRHRLAANGDALHYVAVVARKAGRAG